MNAPPQSQRVWDLPTRLFHWSLVVLIGLQYATGEFHFLDMDWHFRFGYATLVLIAFRVLWGFFGSQTSRFADFVRGPGAVWRYLRESMSAHVPTRIGHNPLGGWSVLALLACVAVQAISGLFASDDIDTDGPLVAHVSGKTVKLMTRVHHWNENLLLVLIGLHIVAVLLYLLLKHDNLITPMFTGAKRVGAMRDLRFASSWLALVLVALCAALVATLVWWAA
ncbi:MAG: cytochrome b/b6 domain-containing protein [Proteobacteria bacterium]|nr:cytochrome b/b6 domain-containing protein [Pseudomonadota bacterium]